MRTQMLAASLCFLFVTAQARADVEKSKHSLDEEIAAANGSSKPLIVEFTADWCGPCRTFDRDVLSKSTVKEALKKVHFVKYDIDDKGPGDAARTKYGVKGVPTILLVGSNGGVISRHGFLSQAKFIELIEGASLSVLSKRELLVKVAADPKNPKLLLRAARWFRDSGDKSQAEAHYKRALAADRTGAADSGPRAAWELMMMRRHRDFRRRVARESLSFAKKFRSERLSGLELIIAGVSGDFSAETIERAAAATLAKTTTARLNATAYSFMAAGALDAALAAAQKQVELKPDDANALDTLAEVLYMRGEQKDAIALSDKAVRRGKTSRHSASFVANNKRFRTKGDIVLDASVAMRRSEAKEQLARPAGHDPVSQRRPEREISSKEKRREALAAVFQKRRDALEAVATACRPSAGNLAKAYVRIELAANGGAPKKVSILEPKISSKLRRCLLRELKRADLPRPYKPNDPVVVEAIMLEQPYDEHHKQTRKALSRVVSRCSEKAGGLTKVFVRVELRSNGGRPKKVSILEPDIPKALSDCVGHALKRADFPKPYRAGFKTSRVLNRWVSVKPR